MGKLGKIKVISHAKPPDRNRGGEECAINNTLRNGGLGVVAGGAGREGEGRGTVLTITLGCRIESWVATWNTALRPPVLLRPLFFSRLTKRPYIFLQKKKPSLIR